MQYLKWGGIAIVALLAWSWLKHGVSTNANFSAQAQPMGWGSGMVYAPGSAYTQQSYPYGYPWHYPGSQPTAYAFGGQVPMASIGNGAPPWYAYLLNAPISADYSSGGGFDASYGS